MLKHICSYCALIFRDQDFCMTKEQSVSCNYNTLQKLTLDQTLFNLEDNDGGIGQSMVDRHSSD